jgi:hypothetical protein
MAGTHHQVAITHFLRQERIQRRINVNPHPYLKNSPSAGTSLQIARLTNISPKSNSKKV